MRLTRFQLLATTALASVLLLIFVGAIVRVTGSGMGCPDWPTCWGCLVPPTRIEQVDFAKLPVEKFQKKAERLGRTETVTRETLRRDFNPRHIWTEYINRLCSLPVGVLALALFIASFWQLPARKGVFAASFGALALVLANAWMGARVVYSGLRPGVLTTHLALAMLLIGVLVYVAWRGTDAPWRVEFPPGKARRTRWIVLLFLLVTVAEGIMGSQIRELTDGLAKSHAQIPRAEWIGELERSWIYLVHRSFSWAVLGMAILSFMVSRTSRVGGRKKIELAALGIVLVQMVLGVVMVRVILHAAAQVLHVGLAAVLLAVLWLWNFGLWGGRQEE